MEDKELTVEATVKESLTVQTEGVGSINRDSMLEIARDRYEDFDQNRLSAGAKAADLEDLKNTEQLEQELKIRL